MIGNALISTAVAPIHRKSNFTSEMVTQGLMFESLSIRQKKDNWYNVMMDDGYEGWIHTFYLSDSKMHSTNNLILYNRYTPIRSKCSRDSNVLALLSFGTLVPLLEKTSKYYRIQIINGDEGFIPPQSKIVTCSRDFIIHLAYSQIGTPYLWGGKSSFGYDCSGFIQMVLKAAGISVNRDASQQAETEQLEKISMEEAEPGDLIFFSESNLIKHVAFIAGDGKIIHCEGQVKLESIIEGEVGFNNSLGKMYHQVTSIAKLIYS